MNISDLNYLEVVSQKHHIFGGYGISNSLDAALATDLDASLSASFGVNGSPLGGATFAFAGAGSGAGAFGAAASVNGDASASADANANTSTSI
ncbi:hypothetical protein [Lyngbya aestuarii]|uniref:hypothetical protein n=1 Tax=Lyngbya aestuarii TaxID=118322 RepID=UPI00403D558C